MRGGAMQRSKEDGRGQPRRAANRSAAASAAGQLPPAGFDRITFQSGKMGGRACIRGMRVTVGLIVALVAEGIAWEEILRDYPYLEREDIRQALAYAAWLTRDEVVPA
jgi:uncharacterized protein (DUF433 family)